MKINSNRIRYARLFQGFSQKDIAEKLDVTPRTIRAYESGDSHPENIQALAKILDFPPNFFFGHDLIYAKDGEISFRAVTKLKSDLKEQAETRTGLAFLFSNQLEKKFKLPSPNIPDFSDLSPEEAAISLRSYWHIDDGKISNMIALLEKNGVHVYSLSMDTDVDANCTWNNDRPFIFLNNQKSAERSRFDAAHELGHLIRDRFIDAKDARSHIQKEKEANEFASAFLMPETSLRRHTPKFVTVDTLIVLKELWGVSVAALAYRLYQLGIVSEWIYKRVLSPEIAKRGYRVSEPHEMERETSLLFKKIKEQSLNSKELISEISRELSFHEKFLHELTFNLFGFNSITGTSAKSPRQKSTTHLKIV